MGVEYLRSVHGILSSLIVLLCSFSLFVGYFVWHEGSVYFLFVLSGWPLLTMVLVFTFVTWMTTIVVLLAQTMGKDLLEELGKLKVLIIHGICLALICASAIVEAFYMSNMGGDHYYFPRLLMTMIALWVILICILGQVIFVVLQ